MNLRSPRVWIAAFSALGVLGIALVDLGRKAPGVISAVHGQVAGLAADCSECHGGWGTSMTEACLECHAPIATQLSETRGLHGRLEQEISKNCSLCHGEHYGADFPLVNVRSFAFAGVPDPTAFDHNLIGFAMGGKHLELSCVECHDNAEATFLCEGEQRFIGLTQDCASCHEDPHAGQMAGACASCHGQEEFAPIAPATHERYLALSGGHAQASCRDCHAQDTEHALEALGRGQRSPAARDCLVCHESPHQEQFSFAAADYFKASVGGACLACHEAEHTSFRSSDLDLSVEEHALSGFTLEGPHFALDCGQCHRNPESANFAERYPGRLQGECSACHEDPHAGQFQQGPFAGQECTACHTSEHFTPHNFSVELHERARLPLDGAHLTSECYDCHVEPQANQARLFHGTDPRCSSCHADAHLGFFEPRLAQTQLPEHGSCALCHTTESFAGQGVRSNFDHSQWTGFAVLGAHAQAECEVCHPAAPQEDQAGRSFGRVAEHFGDYTGCVTCHIDPHEGRFDQPHLPSSVGAKTDCARCHTESTFRLLPEQFDHGLWTGYALDGAHAALACSSCHAPLRRPTASGRTWANAKGSACADCHTDPHAGQFLVAGNTDCARCHQSAAAFSELIFNHERDSQFSLGEAHSPLECGACHKPFSATDPTVRYRPLPRECADCHGRQDHPLRRLRGRNG